MRSQRKKWIALLTAVAALSVTALTGCKEKAPETAAEETKIEAAVSESSGESTEATSDKKDPNRTIKIGFLFSNISAQMHGLRPVKMQDFIWKRTVKM